ncbi:hypothetical protein JYK14_19390 [Siccirubricoccus sp. KC 17139]|uniref:Lipoprotein n=1 Tax=Siccirubricoccus soli TaxID=2899147 RepID=A0ABT1D8P1_9PROT|nr:hypothetical protein [Siccirubricoccus soli]MCO6418312.1 hypothetical protein [Siccirubricoccus soli]MCP2684447.1 hypothetical protein [Siccirubricoccus soli]
MRGAVLALLLLPLGACAGRRGCEADFLNQGSMAVEQLHLAPEAGGPATDLLPDAALPPGGSLRLPFPAEGSYRLRAVWVNGRDVALGGLRACEVKRVVAGDAAMGAE